MGPFKQTSQGETRKYTSCWWSAHPEDCRVEGLTNKLVNACRNRHLITPGMSRQPLKNLRWAVWKWMQCCPFWPYCPHHPGDASNVPRTCTMKYKDSLHPPDRHVCCLHWEDTTGSKLSRQHASHFGWRQRREQYIKSKSHPIKLKQETLD